MAKIIVVKHRSYMGLAGNWVGKIPNRFLMVNTVSRELVVGGEPRRVGALCDDTFQRLLAQRVDTLASYHRRMPWYWFHGEDRVGGRKSQRSFHCQV